MSNSIVVEQFEMSAGQGAVWGGDAPYSQVVEETLGGQYGEPKRTVYTARSPWGEQAYANLEDATREARRMARG